VVTTFTLAGYLGSLTILLHSTRKLSARITQPMVQPTRKAIANMSLAIKVTRLYERYKKWLDPSSPESTSPAREPPAPAPEKGKVPVPAEQPSTKEEASKKSGLHRRLFRWRRRGDLDGGVLGRELEADVERSAVGAEIKS